MKYFSFLLFFPLFLLLSACGKEQTTGPVDVRWDREICARCAMAVSDHKFAAEVRGARKNKKAKVYKFDDVGCAVIWLDQQNWKNDARTEIWVKSHKTEKWIDAKKAWYVELKNTPMDYGLGAQKEKVEGAQNFEQAKKHIYEVEQRFNPHTGKPRAIDDSSPEKGLTNDGNNDKK